MSILNYIMQPFGVKQKVTRRRMQQKRGVVQVYNSYFNDVRVRFMDPIRSYVARRPVLRPVKQLRLGSIVDQIAGLVKYLPYRDLPLLFASTGLLLFLIVSAFSDIYDPFYLSGRRPITMPASTVDIIQPVTQNFVASNNTIRFQPVQAQEYVVEPGDTISELAYRSRLRMDTLISFNGIENVRRLRAGDQLSIPNRDGLLRTVQNGETLEGIAEQYGISVNSILDANNLDSTTIAAQEVLFLPEVALSSKDLKIAMGEYFYSPTRGRLTSSFGLRRSPFTGAGQFHYGIDIANGEGTTVRAARPGLVSYVGYRSSTYGHFIIIRHDREFQTLYAHLEKPDIAIGTKVQGGQIIASMGNSGKSTGSHLHFGVIRNGKFVNPLQYIDY